MPAGRSTRLPDPFSVAWPVAIAVAAAWGVLLLWGGDARGLLTGGPALMRAAGAARSMPSMSQMLPSAAGDGRGSMSMLGIALPDGAGVLSWPVFGAFCWMWAVMVAAMMLPVGLPALARRGIEPRARFVGGSLLPWLLLAAPAYAILLCLQVAFSHSKAHTVQVAAVLVLAGAGYELTSLKRRCRQRCCALEHGSRWGDGVRLGAACVGCCGPMMGALMLVAMSNVVWMAAFSVVMVAERSLRWGHWLSRVAAAALAVGALSVLLTLHELPAFA